jgi:hypothetical protein
LLRCLASGRGDVRIDTFDATEIDWAVTAGLAPLLLAKAEKDARATAAVKIRPLLAGDLTTKVVTGTLIDAMAEILRMAGARATEITLLKGISVCVDLYDKPHQRVMGDIDVLVEPGAQAWLEALLTTLAYRQRSPLHADFYATHSHSMPFHHPQQPVCIEVHTALFPAQMAVAGTPSFTLDEVLRQRVPCDFRGYATQRLRPEVQIAYIATHMAERLTFAREASAFVDIILLLRKYGERFNWDLCLRLLGDGVAVNHLHVVLSYLQRDELVEVPGSVLARLGAGHAGIGPMNLWILHRIIDNYLLSPPKFFGVVTDWTLQLAWESLLQRQPAWHNLLAIPWNVVFIPRHPERFSPAFHWWRLRSWLAKVW